MKSTNDNLPTNRHSTKADVMGVRWLRAVASFILLKTKKGRAFYFLLVASLTIPNIAAIIVAPASQFFHAKPLLVGSGMFALPSALLKLEFADCLYETQFSKIYKMEIVKFCAACGEFHFWDAKLVRTAMFLSQGAEWLSGTKFFKIYNTERRAFCAAVFEFQTWLVELCKSAKCFSQRVVRFNGTQFSKMYKIEIVAFCAAAGEFQTWLVKLCRADIFFEQIVFIFNFFKVNTCKCTNNFVITQTFYGFAEVRGLFVFNKIKFPITEELTEEIRIINVEIDCLKDRLPYLENELFYRKNPECRPKDCP